MWHEDRVTRPARSTATRATPARAPRPGRGPGTSGGAAAAGRSHPARVPVPELPPAGTHGGDGPAVAAALGVAPDDLLDLSQNLNPFAPDVPALLGRHLASVRRYPDPAAATRLLADAVGVPADRLLLTNGGSEAIRLVTAEIGGRVAAEPEFALHPRASSSTGGTTAPVPVWRSDPHSPSGALAPPGRHADVWDEAFYALATGRWTARRPGSLVVGSLTKTFACPGLRLGFVLADDVGRFARHQPHWSVGTPALAVLPGLLEAADLPRWRDDVADARARLVGELRGRGLDVESRAAPWVLVHDGSLRAALAPHGVLVRDCTSFGLPGVTRVAVPDEAGLARLVTALERAGR